MERIAFALIPEHYDESAGLFNRKNPYRPGYRGLDYDDGTLIRNMRDSGFNLIPIFILVATPIILFIIGTPALIIYCIYCRKDIYNNINSNP